MEVINAKDYTILVLRIEEDLDYILEALDLLQLKTKDNTKSTEILALATAISNCAPKKDIQLRFS